MSNYSEEDIEYIEEILNKIKNKEPLSRDDYYWLIYECDVYTKEGDNDGYYEFNSTLSKLNNTYIFTNWNYDLTGDRGNEYEYPIIVKDIKTNNYKSVEENELHLPIFDLEEGIKYLSKRLLIERLNKQVTNHYNEIELIKDLFSKIGSVVDYHNNKPFTKENDREIIIY